MDIAAGGYGYDLYYFRRMLEACAVDVLQPDATRCGGITGFLRVAALCQAHDLSLSTHGVSAAHGADVLRLARPPILGTLDMRPGAMAVARCVAW